MPRRGSKNPPFLLARQEGKAPVDEKRPTPGDRKRQGISTDQRWKRMVPTAKPYRWVHHGVRRLGTSAPPWQQKPPIYAATATRKGSCARKTSDSRGPKTPGNQHGYGGKGWFPRPKQCPAAAAEITPFCCRGSEERLPWPKTSATPGAENARESARIWRKGWFPRRGTSVLPRQQKSPTSAAAATREGSGGRKPVRRPRAENARQSARIRWKRVVPTAEAEPCRGSRNHPPSAAAATRKGSRGRKPVRRPWAENARESARIRGRGRFPHPGTSLLPRQQKSATSAAAATREKLWRSPGPVYCRGPGGGYGPRVYWGVKHGSEPVYCRGSRNSPLLLPRQRGKTVALSGSCVLQGSRRGLWPSGILGG